MGDVNDSDSNSPNLEKVYAEAGEWLRMVNNLGWAIARIFIPLSVSGLWFAIQYPSWRWVFFLSSAFLFAFWILVSFLYRRTTIDARDVLMEIEKRWRIDSQASLYVKQEYMKGRFSGVAKLQIGSFALLIALWVFLLWITPPLQSGELSEMQKQVDQLSQQISATDQAASARVQALSTELRDHVQNAPTRSELADIQRRIDKLGGPNHSLQGTRQKAPRP